MTRAEVGDEGHPPTGRAVRVAGEHAAEHGQAATAKRLKHDPHDGHELVLAEG